jgi:cyclophilin family peptidyl-prolyl cis-trans isomerase
MKKSILLVTLITLFSSMSNLADAKDSMVLIETSQGNIKVRLYDETPLHRDNFIKLAKEGYFNDLLFHRVIKGFMIQGGDPDSKNAPAGKSLGMGGPGYQIPAEIVYPKLFHKRGALAAARTGDQMNPERKSSGSQFYIVWGEKYDTTQLNGLNNQLKQQAMQSFFQDLASQRKDTILKMQNASDNAGLQKLQSELIALTEAEFKNHPDKGSMTAEQKLHYSTVGGTPMLDNQYTVFGEVVEGLEVVEKIQNTATNAEDRPKSDIKMKISVIN